MHPTRMAFVAIGTTIAFLAGLAWTGAYFASAGPSASELPHQAIDLPLVASVSTVIEVGMSSDFGIHTPRLLADAFAVPTTTTTATTLPAPAATNPATTASGRRPASTTRTVTGAGAAPTSSTSRPPAASISPPSTTSRLSSTTTRTPSTTVKKLVSPNTTVLYFETSLPAGDDESTDREVVRPRLREDHD